MKIWKWIPLPGSNSFCKHHYSESVSDAPDAKTRRQECSDRITNSWPLSGVCRYSVPGLQLQGDSAPSHVVVGSLESSKIWLLSRFPRVALSGDLTHSGPWYIFACILQDLHPCEVHTQLPNLLVRKSGSDDCGACDRRCSHHGLYAYICKENLV